MIMKYMYKSTFIFMMCISATMYSQKKKAILIGIDGLQFEKIADVNTPNFDKLNIKKGFTGGIHGTKSQQVTSSGPSWMSILTGVWTDQHKIVNNAGEKHAKSPSIFNFIKSQKKDTYLASISTWKQINLLLKNDMYKVNFSTQGGTDVLSTELIIDQITKYSPDFSFVHLDDIDHAGHAFGFGKKYNEAIEQMDSLLGDILKTVKEREHKYHEDWLVIIVTDHGRDTNGFHHGGQTVEEKTIFMGMNKEGNERFMKVDNNRVLKNIEELETLLPLTSIVPTVLKHLDISIKKEWKLDAESLID